MRPTILQQDDNYDSFGRGMATQSFQKADTNFDIEVKEFLLKHLRKYGDDIRAIDMQRGRDHGINGYNNYRELCGRKRAKKWEDLLDVMIEFVRKINFQHLMTYLIIFHIFIKFLERRKVEIGLLKHRRR